ncbi:transcriptional regulator, GntR family [Cohaesibacter marisflavi]|uniref:Transcriptional regulator, GntR family n=1 Tax=Cohaesibacter marisflavi TaxID=655353 RepID=A0A1I5J7U2_9HYPH|nr:GntR family transcriptional regulator [Cohaesibacter marisflavi]SFO68802.1 transcriptional regulator, GntR family [Cohaesibacter marisflavi]
MKWTEHKIVANGVPRWLQIAEILREAIEDGSFAVGQSIPTEAEINKAFDVSRTTTRAAMQKLVQDGLISRRAGLGSIVVDQKVDQPLHQIRSFSEDMESRGMTASYEVLSCGLTTATPEATHGLGLASGDRPFHIERLLKGNDRLIGYSQSFVRPDIFNSVAPPDADFLSQGSLYDWIATELGIKINGGVEFIEAGLADAFLAKTLDVKEGDPVLVAHRTAQSEAGLPIEFAVITYRADRYRFRVEL